MESFLILTKMVCYLAVLDLPDDIITITRNPVRMPNGGKCGVGILRSCNNKISLKLVKNTRKFCCSDYKTCKTGTDTTDDGHGKFAFYSVINLREPAANTGVGVNDIVHADTGQKA